MTRYVGIDVSKDRLDGAERPSGEDWQEPNDPAGWAAIVARLAGPAPVLVVLEASGAYEAGLVLALDAAGLTPAVLNPLAARRFAQSLGIRAKTDAIDAGVLARFAERMQPVPRPVPEATARQLRDLLARDLAVTKMLAAEKTRRHQASALLRAQIETHIVQLEAQRAELKRLLASVIATDPTWAAKVALVDSVPGFALLSAVRVVAWLPELGQLPAGPLAALVGVAPHPHESGRWRGTRTISGGRAPVRHALYEATTSTIRWDPTMAAHYRQLIDRGKPHKVALVACMRRLLGILSVMLREHLTWDQTDVGAGRLLAAPV